MGLSSLWGKREVADTDVDKTEQESEAASSDYERSKEFRDRLKVNPEDLKKTEKPDDVDSTNEDDFDEMESENGMERERTSDDDEGVR